VALEDGRVAFRYKDYADAHRHKTMTLSAEEFLRRFVQHVLPAGFVKTRHYGLLANRSRDEKLRACRRRLLVARVEAEVAPPAETVEVGFRRCCPNCGSTRLIVINLPKGAAVDVVDTS
jgi:hypothetical protein